MYPLGGFNLKRYCSDNNPKIVKRVYNWDGKRVEISLCEQHKEDPDFSHYILEEPICL